MRQLQSLLLCALNVPATKRRDKLKVCFKLYAIFKSPQVKIGPYKNNNLTLNLKFNMSWKEYSAAIEKDIDSIPLKELQNAFHSLADRYREIGQRKNILAKGGAFILNRAERSAYLGYRLPATFAVCVQVLKQLTSIFEPISLVDLGAGPGTLSLAALSVFPTLQKVTLLEQDREWGIAARHLHGVPAVPLNYLYADFTKETCPAADLIASSYALSELPSPLQSDVVKEAWNKAEKGVVFIEPGTPYGFAAILNARSTLIALGAQIAAPCPHIAACPLAAKGEWCHFSERLERSKMHRLLKGGELGYEDEKYSYLIAAKVPFPRYEARLVHSPEKHGGHIRLALCTEQGLLCPTYSKKEGEIYKRYRKLEWGDCIKELNM